MITQVTQVKTQQTNPKNDYSLMKQYYYLYPFDEIFKMINMNVDSGGEQHHSSRIMGLSYIGNHNVYEKKDLALGNASEFKSNIVDIVPMSLHMDYQLNTDARKVGYYHTTRERKELVFDLDLTDYQRFCDCDGKKQYCTICWLHIEGSIMILDHFLQITLQYRPENILWIFSGGKGIHCLVNSRQAINLDGDERQNLYNMLAMPGGKDNDNFVSRYVGLKNKTHPKFMSNLYNHFLKEVIRERNILKFTKFEAFCIDRLMSSYPSFANTLKKSWTNFDNGIIKKKCRTIEVSNVSEKKWSILERLEYEISPCEIRPSHFIMIHIFYPMIDAGPLKLHHKFKLPFSIHYTTKNIALPVEKEKLLSTTFSESPLTLSKITERRDTEMALYSNSIDLLSKWNENYNK
jgi:DNA primase small subunit